MISDSLDDRTPEEMGQRPLERDRYRINKSRYDSVSCYLTPQAAHLNDTELVIDSEMYTRMVESGVDHLMAQHVAHLFIRDPIVLYRETLNVDDEPDQACYF